MLRISKADLSGQGENLVLNATVTAPTLGWKVELSPLIYVKPPEDGIQEFELYGTPPSGFAGQALENHELKIEVPTSDWMQGVGIKEGDRVHLKILRPVLKQNSVGGDFVSTDQPGLRNADKLIIPVRYSGGCKKHEFQLNWDGKTMESMPLKVELELSHDSNNDMCQALISEDLQFDLSVLQGLPQSNVVLVVKSQGSEYRVPYNI